MKSFSSDQSLSFQSWILYRLRFIISAEVCSAWDLYGGIIAQINNLGVTLNISISENVGTALKYFDFPHTQLESYARSRAADVDYFRLLSEEQQEIKRRFSKTPLGLEGSSSQPSISRNWSRNGGDRFETQMLYCILFENNYFLRSRLSEGRYGIIRWVIFSLNTWCP